MSDDFAVEPQPSEAELPEGWREHVREVRRAREAKDGALSDEEFEPLIARMGEQGHA